MILNKKKLFYYHVVKRVTALLRRTIKFHEKEYKNEDSCVIRKG